MRVTIPRLSEISLSFSVFQSNGQSINALTRCTRRRRCPTAHAIIDKRGAILLSEILRKKGREREREREGEKRGGGQRQRRGQRQGGSKLSGGINGRLLRDLAAAPSLPLSLSLSLSLIHAVPLSFSRPEERGRERGPHPVYRMFNPRSVTVTVTLTSARSARVRGAAAPRRHRSRGRGARYDPA